MTTGKTTQPNQAHNQGGMWGALSIVPPQFLTLSNSLVFERAPLHSKCKNEYLVFALGEETAVQAVVGSTRCLEWQN